MKRRILLSCIALCSVVMSVVAQRSYNFNAVALNVDGLPEKIGSFTVNEKAPGAAGATALCNAIANSGWAFCGFSEDFNYHSELTAAPAKNYYNFGVHGGSVDASAILGGADTDGLGIACAKYLTLSGGTRKEWSEYNGFTDQGADGLISKGFRVYTVTFATNIAVDVYVLHMDAEDGSGDIRVRKKQLGELATYIKNNHNNRPVIILGDTNCRYTRDELKTAFIDVINADGRFTIKDAWVELMRDGVYPTYGSDAMMTHTYGAQKGEVVDKVFYINTTKSNLELKANSYLNDESYKNYTDHNPIVVNFTLTNPNGTPVNQELSTPDETVETWTDGTPTNPGNALNGKEYYLRNVHSGLFLKGGMNWGAHIGEGHDGMPVKFTYVSNNNTYKLSAPTLNAYVGNNYYTDNGSADAANWIVEKITSQSNKGKTMTKYIFKNTSENQGKAIASSGNGWYADGASYNKADTKQQWVLYTKDEMVAAIKSEMTAALKGAQYNASGLITLPVCCNENETRQTSWTRKENVGAGGRGPENNAGAVWEVFRWGDQAHEFDFNQTLSSIPNGTYTVKVQAFFRDGDANTQSTTVNPVLYAGNKSTKIHSILDGALANQPSWQWGHQNSKGWIPNDMWQANQWFRAGHYTVTLENVTVSNGTLKLGIKNTTSSGNIAWCCFDNFQLYYHGTAQGDLRTSELYKSIKAAVDKAIATIKSLNSAEATAAFDLSTVVWRYNNNCISSDGAVEFAMIDQAVKTAVASQTTLGANMSLLIANNSFEEGTTIGWNVAQKGWDTNAIKNEGSVATSNGDGTYQFNTWSGDQYECGTIYQNITGLRNGHYRLNAMIASWNDRSVYLVGNKQHASIATTQGEGRFVDFGLDFLVEEGSALIGAVGAGDGGNFYFKKGIFFKADNFRLTYMGPTGQGRVKIALADAKAKAAKLHEGAKAQFNTAVAKYESATITGDGKAEETAIYNALKAAIATQPRTETDMTWLIANPGFETGDWTGWSKPEAWESKVFHATHSNAPSNGEGQYIVNVWNNHADATNSGVNAPVHQTLKGLPNGRYRLTADVTSDNGNPVAIYATVSGQTQNDTIQPTNNGIFKTADVKFEVTNNADVTIGAVGYRNGTFNAEGGCWYKCDNFRLTFLGHEGEFSQDNSFTANDWYTSVNLTRSMKGGKWNTFVVPFDMAIPSGWEVKELTNSTIHGEVISLTFSSADAIKAGVAYMVRVEGNISALPQVNNVQINTTLNNPSTSHIEFKGVYKPGKIPAGSFFISDNVFYQAADDSNTIKAFRAYFQPKTANARALNYRFDGEEGTTGIEEATEEVTVVGIYTLGGVRINDMQEGVNILKMSNGTTMKVIIK